MPDHDLSGRVILITGAGGGLGSVVSRAAAQAGAELVLVGRKLPALETTYDSCTAAGGPQPALFPMDFTKAGADDYQRLVDGIKADCGRLDGIVHLAARFDGLRPLNDFEIAEWQRCLHVNLTAPFAITQACMPLLRAAPDASVIFAGDSVAQGTKAYWGGYAAAKAGLDTLLGMLTAEYRHVENLRFNAINSGPINTPLRRKAFPNGDPDAGEPESIVDTVLYLLGANSQAHRGDCLGPGEGLQQVG